MEIQTYTNVWATPKRLYTIGDMSLPQPVSLTAAGLFLGTLALWAPLLWFLGVPFNSPVGLVLYFSAPIGLAVMGNKPIFEGKSIIQFVMSMFKYWFQPRVWTAMRPDTDMRQEAIVIESKVWVPDAPDDTRGKKN